MVLKQSCLKPYLFCIHHFKLAQEEALETNVTVKNVEIHLPVVEIIVNFSAMGQFQKVYSDKLLFFIINILSMNYTILEL